jgi:hypothetical protein
MPYKKGSDYKRIPIHKSIIKKLNNFRIDDNEAYWKIIKRIMEEVEDEYR